MIDLDQFIEDNRPGRWSNKGVKELMSSYLSSYLQATEEVNLMLNEAWESELEIKTQKAKAWDRLMRGDQELQQFQISTLKDAYVSGVKSKRLNWQRLEEILPIAYRKIWEEVFKRANTM